MTINIIHINPEENWEDFVHLCGNGNVKINNSCKIDSKYCSEENSDMEGLCRWHRLRMARITIVQCGCTNNLCIFGDSTGRNLFREFYDNIDISVIDSIGDLYCCGQSQNTGEYVKKCGEMHVCKNHEHKH
jgi:hypothetical protein